MKRVTNENRRQSSRGQGSYFEKCRLVPSAVGFFQSFTVLQSLSHIIYLLFKSITQCSNDCGLNLSCSCVETLMLQFNGLLISCKDEAVKGETPWNTDGISLVFLRRKRESVQQGSNLDFSRIVCGLNFSFKAMFSCKTVVCEGWTSVTENVATSNPFQERRHGMKTGTVLHGLNGEMA